MVHEAKDFPGRARLAEPHGAHAKSRPPQRHHRTRPRLAVEPTHWVNDLVSLHGPSGPSAVSTFGTNFHFLAPLWQQWEEGKNNSHPSLNGRVHLSVPVCALGEGWSPPRDAAPSECVLPRSGARLPLRRPPTGAHGEIGNVRPRARGVVSRAVTCRRDGGAPRVRATVARRRVSRRARAATHPRTVHRAWWRRGHRERRGAQARGRVGRAACERGSQTGKALPPPLILPAFQIKRIHI